MKKLGILGGMGPAATAHFFLRTIDLTPASSDQDHLDSVILNYPSIPDRTTYLKQPQQAQSFMPKLQEMALELESLGCDVIVLPCNTAHAGQEAIESVLNKATFISMPEVTCAFAYDKGLKTLGVLGTEGTSLARVYEKAANKVGVTILWPQSSIQKIVTSIIYDYVKQGKDAPIQLFDEVYDALQEEGAEGFILGCSELSVAENRTHYKKAPIIDAIDVLAKKALESCGVLPSEA